MNNMDEAELFTVCAFQAHDRRQRQDGASMIEHPNDSNEDLERRTKPIAQFQNMVSARVIKVSFRRLKTHLKLSRDNLLNHESLDI